MPEDILAPAQVDLPALTTARLWLRAMRVEDAPDVFEYAAVPEVLRYTTGTPPTDIEETRAFLRKALTVPDERMWAIQLAGTSAVVGAIEFAWRNPISGSIHYALARRYWGRGLMTEAVEAVCTWLFQVVPSLLEIQTTVAEANIGSARVLEKCGFKRIGTVLERWAKEPEPVSLAVFRLSAPNGPSRATGSSWSG